MGITGMGVLIFALDLGVIFLCVRNLVIGWALEKMFWS